MLRALMDELRAEGGFPRSPAAEERLAAFLLKTYDRGVTCRAKLKAYCGVALKLYFRDDAALEIISAAEPGRHHLRRWEAAEEEAAAAAGEAAAAATTGCRSCHRRHGA